MEKVTTEQDTKVVKKNSSMFSISDDSFSGDTLEPPTAAKPNDLSIDEFE